MIFLLARPFDKDTSRIIRTHIVDQIDHINSTSCIIATPASPIIIVTTKAIVTRNHTNNASTDARTLAEPSEQRSSRISMTDASSKLYTSVVSKLMLDYVLGALTNGISMFTLEESRCPSIVNWKIEVDIGQYPVWRELPRITLVCPHRHAIPVSRVRDRAEII